MKLLFIILIAISLSMDTLSLSLSFGTFNISKKQGMFFALLVGIFHFSLPLLGNLIGISIKNIIFINNNYLLGLIFLFLTIEMAINIFNKEETSVKFTVFGLFLSALSVSIDSFTVGIGLDNITSSAVLSALIFSLFSCAFTCLGLWIGHFSYEKLGKMSEVIGLIIMLFVTIFHFVY